MYTSVFPKLNQSIGFIHNDNQTFDNFPQTPTSSVTVGGIHSLLPSSGREYPYERSAELISKGCFFIVRHFCSLRFAYYLHTCIYCTCNTFGSLTMRRVTIYRVGLNLIKGKVFFFFLKGKGEGGWREVEQRGGAGRSGKRKRRKKPSHA